MKDDQRFEMMLKGILAELDSATGTEVTVTVDMYKFIVNDLLETRQQLAKERQLHLENLKQTSDDIQALIESLKGLKSTFNATKIAEVIAKLMGK